MKYDVNDVKRNTEKKRQSNWDIRQNIKDAKRNVEGVESSIEDIRRSWINNEQKLEKMWKYHELLLLYKHLQS